MQRGVWRRVEEEFKIWRVGVLPGSVIIGLVVLARLTGSLQPLEWSALDGFLRMRPAEPVDERIVIVGINEADIRSVRTYPIPDKEIAALLRKLQTYQPRVIGLDIVRDIPAGAGNAELMTAFKNSRNLIAIEKVLPDQIHPPPQLPSDRVGFVDAITDTDSHLRRSLLATNTPQGYKFSLSLRLAEAYLSKAGFSLENGIRDRLAMRFGSTELPRFMPNSGGYVRTDAGGSQVLINFRSGHEPFHTLSLSDIKTGNFNSNWLRDRIVIVGITAPSVKDIVSSSAIISDNPAPGLVYGVEIQAHAVSQIVSAVLNQRPLLKFWSDGQEYLWILAWGFLGISLGRLTQSPLKNLLGVGLASVVLVGVSYLLLVVGWWISVAPAAIALLINGVSLTAFYQYDRNLKSRISDRQFVIDRTFDMIHNGPMQTLKEVLRHVREQDPSAQLLSELEHLNHELWAVDELVRRETLDRGDGLYLSSASELNLQTPIHEVLYQVYSHTLERNFSCFKTLRVKICTFDPIDHRRLSIEQKRGLCRFLEEALCNVGKHAKGVTHLNVTCTQKGGWYILRIVDNGLGISSSSEGRGTQQCRNLARQLRGKFQRSSLTPTGTLCELTWPVTKLWFW